MHAFILVAILPVLWLVPTAHAFIPPEGCGTFSDAVLHSTGNPTSIAMGDLDGDGDLDIAVTNGVLREVTILVNHGGGAFEEGAHFPAEAPVHVAIGDLDGDLDLDLVVANDLSGDVSVLLNEGDGTFTAEVRYGAGNTPRCVALSDFDGDQDMDLVVANGGASGGGYDASILLNNGDGTFVSDVRYAVGLEPFSVVTGDLDGDGDPDVAVPNRLGDDVSILLNDGDGIFAPEVCYDAGFFPEFGAVGDLDGDGDLDLVVTNAGMCTGHSCIFTAATVLLNHGDGTFAIGVPYDTGGRPTGLAIGDVDGDLDLDLVVTNRNMWGGNDNLAVLLNDGGAVFDQSGYYEAGLATMGVAIGDLDADGDLDLATANSGSDDVSVFLNDCPDSCPADIDGSGSVEFSDILAILSTWGQAGGPQDIDGSATVDFGDLLMVLSSWGPCP